MLHAEPACLDWIGAPADAAFTIPAFAQDTFHGPAEVGSVGKFVDDLHGAVTITREG
jgi:hypothetical protein